MKLPPPILKLQRSLRKNMPQPELLLWRKIRKKQLGVKFRRQYPVYLNPIPTFPLLRGRRNELSSSPFLRGRLGGGLKLRILDFYAPTLKLGIEIDGDTHFVNKQTRDLELELDQKLSGEFGINVMRFLNIEITQNLQGVLEEITQYIHNPPKLKK